MVYGPDYRHGDLMRQNDFLDSRDMQVMQSVAVVGAVMLLPVLQFQSTLVHYFMTVLFVASSALMIAGSAYLCRQTPVANQVCLAGAIAMAATAGFCVTNMARAFGFAFG